MRRWGSEHTHRYILGLYDDLRKAIDAAFMNYGHRGSGKYEPYITKFSMNREDRKVVVEGIEELKKLMNEWSV